MSKRFRFLIGAIALLLIAVSVLAIIQYKFLDFQLRRRTASELRESVGVMRDSIAFGKKWDLVGYRRTSEGADVYIVIAADGTIIDISGFWPGMLSRVSLPTHFDYEHPFRLTSSVDEDWILYVHRLRDGIVVLGVRTEAAPANIENHFAINAMRFGNSVGNALITPERTIDESFDYAIIDASGVLRWAIGGIPLKTVVPPEIPSSPRFTPVKFFGKRLYATYSKAINNSEDNRPVGMITAFENQTAERHVLYQSALFNAFIISLLFAAAVFLEAFYLRRTRLAEISCAEIPRLQESDIIEFKSSLRWNYRDNKRDREMERVIVKTVAGFLNSHKGGTLIIGVDDKGNPLGLQCDYATLNSKPNRDGFEQALRNVLINSIGEGPCASWINIRFCAVQGKDLCIVRITPATKPIFPREKGADDQILYVRLGNTTTPLMAREAVAYSHDRWGGITLRRPHFSRFAIPAIG